MLGGEAAPGAATPPPTVPIGSGGYMNFKPAPKPPPVYRRQDVDSLERVKSRVTERLRPLPDDDVDTIDWKYRTKRSIEEKFSSVAGQMTPDDIDEIFRVLDEAYAPKPEPIFGAFSQESQAMLQEALGGELPMRRSAGPDDIDPSQAAAMGAFTLLNLVSGKGQFSDVLKGVTRLTDNAQGSIDQQYAMEIEQDKIRRQHALKQFERMTQLEDFRNQQAGYEARDARTAEREEAKGVRDMQRQETGAVARQRQAAVTQYMGFLERGDPVRAEEVKRLFEWATGESFGGGEQLQKTTAQENQTQQTELMKVNTEKAREFTTGLRFKNKVNAATFDAQVQEILNKSENGSLVIDKLKKELEVLPEKLRLSVAKQRVDIALVQARTDAVAKQAEAALIKAWNGSEGSAAAIDKNQWKQINDYRAQLNTEIDNLNARDGRLASDLTTLEVRRNSLLDMDQSTVQVDAQIKVLEQQRAQIKAEIDKKAKTMTGLGQIMRTAIPDLPAEDDEEVEVPDYSTFEGLARGMGNLPPKKGAASPKASAPLGGASAVDLLRAGSTCPPGMDCSAFTQKVYKQFGRQIPRTAVEQYKASQRVGRGELKRGDLVFWETVASAKTPARKVPGGYVTHVGIYMGNGRMMHDPGSNGGGMKEVSMSEYGRRFKFLGGGRL